MGEMGETDCVERAEIRGSRAESGEDASSGFAILSGPSERSAIEAVSSGAAAVTEVWLERGRLRGLPCPAEGRLSHYCAIDWLAGRAEVRMEVLVRLQVVACGDK
jgi:hypothetical protein